MIKCLLHPTYYVICSRNRELCKDEEYVFPALYMPPAGKMKTINMGRNTPIKIKCNRDAIQDKFFRKVIATRLVQ